MRFWIPIVVLVLASAAEGREIGGPGPLLHVPLDNLAAVVPAGTSLMTHSEAIEHFLEELDGKPPDWVMLYGHGHHDPGLDDRLFTLNRERDAKREGNLALGKPLAFAWAGVLSPYDPAAGAFPVALGPRIVRTSWGMVRFKPDDAPGNLSVVTNGADRAEFERLLTQGEPVEIDVIMTGRLVPEESIVYDFSHDEEGLGLIMPFVRVEHVYFVLLQDRCGSGRSVRVLGAAKSGAAWAAVDRAPVPITRTQAHRRPQP